MRVIAEDELRDLGACMLDLAGLYGGERDPKNWVMRVATTKEQVKGKLALHLAHGADVAVRLNRGLSPAANRSRDPSLVVHDCLSPFPPQKMGAGRGEFRPGFIDLGSLEVLRAANRCT